LEGEELMAASSRKNKEVEQAKDVAQEVRAAPTPESDREPFDAIQQAAYFKAEQDGFRKPPTDYWLAAQDEIIR
jgi:hypothetical protein